MDEFELIHRYFLQRGSDASVSIGIGDDGAILSPAPGRQLVAVVDTMVAGVHYPLNFPAEHAGFRALAVNLSDVAAMAGTPRWMTLALTLAEARPEWLGAFAAGLFDAAREHRVSLVGGDTTRGRETVISVQLLGEVEPGRVLTRSGAGAGDDIYVSGTVGDAAAGLALLQQGGARDEEPGPASSGDAAFLEARFARPAARVDVGLAIADLATAAIDLSDGLGADLCKLLEASGSAGTIETRLLPLSAALRRQRGEDAIALALDGGDDYELCFTAKARDRARLQGVAERLGTPLTRIGQVAAGAGLECITDGHRSPWKGRGYRHF